MKKLSEANIDLREDILQDLQRFAKEYELEKLILFGSRARGTNHERSDIDIAAYFGDSVKYLDFCDSGTFPSFFTSSTIRATSALIALCDSNNKMTEFNSKDNYFIDGSGTRSKAWNRVANSEAGKQPSL